MALPKKMKESVKHQVERLLEQGRRFDYWKYIRQRHFWSTHLFKPDVNGYIQPGVFQLFVTPAGQAGQGFRTALTALETNWKGSNRVPDNQNLEVTEMGVSLFSVPRLADDEPDEPTDDTLDHSVLRPFDAVSFLQATGLAITYLTNQVELGMVNDFAQASGPTVGSYQPGDSTMQSGTTQADTVEDVRYATNGFPGPGLRRRYKIPLLLQHGETFSFTFFIPRAFFMFPFNVVTPLTDDPFTRFIYARLDLWATESFVEKS